LSAARLAPRLQADLNGMAMHRDTLHEFIDELIPAKRQQKRAAMHRAMNLPSNVTTLPGLVKTLETLIKLERLAFHLEDVHAKFRHPKRSFRVRLVVLWDH
jgi:hypothetical protein